MRPVRTVEHIPWATLLRHLRRSWQPGHCVTIVGPRGSGKTHIALTILEMMPHVLVLSTKRRDPLIDELRAKGYLVTGDLDEILWTERDGPVRKRIVYWPQFPERISQRERLAQQAHRMREAIAWADRTGQWAIMLDETMWLVESLGLEQEIKEMYFQGRTQGISVIANAQRPTHIPRLAFSSADYLFLAKTGDRRDVMNLREISTSIPSEMIEEGLRQLDKGKHEFLFVDANNDSVAIVQAPPR